MPSVLSASSTPSHLLRSQRPVDEGGVSLRDVAGLGEQQRHRVLGGRDDIRLRGVDNHHAASRRRIEIDVVEADPGPADDHQVVGGGEQLLVDHRGRADDQRCRAGDRRQQLVPRQPELHVDDVSGGSEALQPALGDLFGDEDAGHGLHAYRRSGAGNSLDQAASTNYVRRRSRRTQTASVPPSGRRRRLSAPSSERGSSAAASLTSSSAGRRSGRSGAGRSRCSSSPTCSSASTPSTSPSGPGSATCSPPCSSSPSSC